MSSWLHKQAIQIVRFVNDPNRVMLRLPNQFGFAFLGIPVVALAALLHGPLSTVLWVLGGFYTLAAFVWAFCITIRADAHRNDRLYDRQTRYFLPPEYRETTSELKGRSR